MQPIVFHDLAAEILFGASLILWITIELMVGVRTDASGRTAREWTQPLIMCVVLSSLVLAAVLAEHQVAPLPGSPWWPVAVGLTLWWSGVAFRLWSVRTLGHFFKMAVVVQDDHRVIDSGPYRWLRHPSYTGALLTNTGIGFALGDLASVAVMLFLPLIAFLIRIRVEERLLLRELGEEYAAYSQRTARLVPGLF
ncbi:MAG: isoprenylcysteine carboxylmethyltransferase family protein [Solirubrobacteraceae bacterium]